MRDSFAGWLAPLVVAALVATGCGGTTNDLPSSGGGDPAAGGDPASGGDGNGDVAGDTDCPLGSWCNAIRVDSLPFVDARDTTAAPSFSADSYSCAPTVSELGGEWVYRVTLSERSLLLASVDDVSGDGVDVDVHLLASADANDCLARGNAALGQLLETGIYYVVVDTWASATGQPYPGPYELSLRAIALESGACAVQATDLEMVWSSCDASLDCFEAAEPSTGLLERYLRTPTVGPVVMEAHLVTDTESFGGGWPTSGTDGLAAHYALSEAATGYVTARAEPWAPAGEGGSEWGQGSTGAKLPVAAEAWYVNMYWQNRPTAGRRMLVVEPVSGRAVIAAGGYETGPGSNTAIGGAVEEIHRWLGTSHRDDLLFGFTVDDSLPLGPYDCFGGAPSAP